MSLEFNLVADEDQRAWSKKAGMTKDVLTLAIQLRILDRKLDLLFEHLGLRWEYVPGRDVIRKVDDVQE